MQRPPKPKLGRQSTAAYAASQPLFAALKLGVEELGEQRTNLAVARDLVQSLHVKLVDENSVTDRSKRDRYVTSIVTAWRVAIDTYTNVFQQLAAVTAADPTEGKPAAKNHEEFTAMLDTVVLARRIALQFPLSEQNELNNGAGTTTPSVEAVAHTAATQDAEDQAGSQESGFDTTPDPEPEVLPVDTKQPKNLHGKRPLPADANPDAGTPQKRLRQPSPEPDIQKRKLNPHIKYAKSGRALWERGAEKPFVPYGTLGSSEKKEWQHEMQRQKREKKRAKKVALKAAKEAKRGAAHYEDLSKPVHERDFISLDSGPSLPVLASSVAPATNGDQVEYVDVAAEVKQRLEAKEARKLKKFDKKRKRESGDLAVGNGEVATSTPSKKPQTKKSRLSQESSSPGKGKRKANAESGKTAKKLAKS